MPEICFGDYSGQNTEYAKEKIYRKKDNVG
jgi:hypothetical protein